MAQPAVFAEGLVKTYGDVKPSMASTYRFRKGRCSDFSAQTGRGRRRPFGS